VVRVGHGLDWNHVNKEEIDEREVSCWEATLYKAVRSFARSAKGTGRDCDLSWDKVGGNREDVERGK
jgi:hypothetical protein